MIFKMLTGTKWGVLEPFGYPPLTKGALCLITSSTLQILQLKGFFGGLTYENPHEHLRNHINVCLLFNFRRVSQEAIRLRLFPFFITGEVVRWLAELLWDSMTSWEELQDAFLERLSPSSKIVKLTRSIKDFK